MFFFNVASNSTGYDCGIYVICVAEELCKNFLASKETPLKDTVTAENIQQKRRELKKLILDLGRTKTWVINAKTIMPIVKILMLTASPKVFWRSLGKADTGLLKLNLERYHRTETCIILQNLDICMRKNMRTCYKPCFGKVISLKMSEIWMLIY